MKSGIAALGILIGTVGVALGEANGEATPGMSEPTLYYIPHTHWEGAVFKTREEYLDMGLVNIIKAVHLLREFPEYKFALDQVAYFKPFLDRYPELEPEFRRYIAEGRLQIVGGMDVMPDDIKPGGELFIRQMQYGKRFCRERLDVNVKTGWLLDTFGHHPQLPQLLRLAGYESFWFCRGVPNNRLPSEFLWRGIDGTTIPAFWLPGFYGLFYDPPREPGRFAEFFEKRYASLDGHAVGNARVGLAGADVSDPESYAPPLVKQFNENPDRPFTIRYSVPAEFEKVVAKRANHPVLEGDFNPIFQGTYSSRIELKQMTRRIEGRLLLAEQLAGLDSWLGKPADTAAIWKAWEPVLFNQTHDLASGVMTDHVYDDVVAGYQFAERLADGIIEQEWAELAGAIDTRGEGIPVVVFNSLGWARTDAAEVELGFSESSVHGVKIFDEGGTEVPAQIMEENRYEDGGLKRARVAFVARAVPALGYAVYHMRTDRAQEASPKTESKTSGDVIENEYYRVTFDLGSGAIASLYDKIGQWEALAGPGNVVSRQVDRGDLWELYRGLDGGSYIAMTNRQAVPKAPEAELSSAFTGTNGAVRIGPVVSEFSVSHGFGSGTFQTRVRLWAGVRRVEIETELVNQEKWVRYQAQFPTPLGEGRYTQEIPFGAAERPAGVEYPAQNWVDFGTSERGVALLNCGMPGNLVSNGTLLLSLMRAETIGGYGYGGGYEPGMSSEGGFELGRLLRFKYALVPHAGDWRKAQVYRAGLELNRPLLVHKASAHGGALPPRWGLAEISANNVVVTALEPARKGGFDLRFYDATGQGASELEIKCAGRVTEAATVNFLEDPGERLKVEGNGVQTTLHPFEIKTIRLRLATRSGNSSVE